MGPFDETITWIRFRADLKLAPPSFWLLLGECVALTNQLRGVPLPPSESRSLNDELLAYGMLARLVLDGSTLRAEQVLHHVAGQLRAPVSQQHDAHDLNALNHAAERLQARSSTGLEPLTTDILLEYHRQLVAGPTGSKRSVWREGPMTTGAPPGVPSEMIPLFTEELCDWLAGPELASPTPEEAPHYALIRSVLAELYLAWIQPFPNAGSRLAGLVSQHILAEQGLIGSWTYLPAVHYHRTRPEFLRQIGHAAQGAGDPIPFLAYTFHGLLDGLKELANAIRSAQSHGQWRAHIEDLFDDQKGPQVIRQRALLLALGEEQGHTATNEIAKLNPELARLYAGVSGKTLQRDIEKLDDLGAVQRSPEGVRARREIVLGFRA